MRLLPLLLLSLSNVCFAETETQLPIRENPALAPGHLHCSQSIRFSGSANNTKTMVDTDINIRKCTIVQYFIRNPTGQCQGIDIVVSNNFPLSVGHGKYGCHVMVTNKFGYYYCMCRTSMCNDDFESVEDLSLVGYAISPEASRLTETIAYTIPNEVEQCVAELKNDNVTRINETSGDAEYVRVFYDCVKGFITELEFAFKFLHVLEFCEEEALSYASTTLATTADETTWITSETETIATTQLSTSTERMYTSTPQKSSALNVPSETSSSEFVAISTENPISLTSTQQQSSVLDVPAESPSSELVAISTANPIVLVDDPFNTDHKNNDDNTKMPSSSNSEGAGMLPWFIVIGVVVVLVIVVAVLVFCVNKANKKQNAARAKSVRNVESPIVVNPMIEIVESPMSISAKLSKERTSIKHTNVTSKSATVLDQTRQPSTQSKE